jgi:hypothetical protein
MAADAPQDLKAHGPPVDARLRARRAGRRPRKGGQHLPGSSEPGALGGEGHRLHRGSDGRRSGTLQLVGRVVGEEDPPRHEDPHRILPPEGPVGVARPSTFRSSPDSLDWRGPVKSTASPCTTRRILSSGTTIQMRPSRSRKSRGTPAPCTWTSRRFLPDEGGHRHRDRGDVDGRRRGLISTWLNRARDVVGPLRRARRLQGRMARGGLNRRTRRIWAAARWANWKAAAIFRVAPARRGGSSRCPSSMAKKTQATWGGRFIRAPPS